MGNNQYMEIFIEESEEHIQNLNDMLLELETDTENLDYLNEMFRSAHTIKGMAGTMGFDKIADLTHSLENILDATRNHTIDLQSDIIDCLFEAIDTLELLFSSILRGDGEEGYDIGPIKEKLKTYLPSAETKNTSNSTDTAMIEEHHIAVIKEALNKDMYPYYIVVNLDPTCLMKSARAYIIFKALEDYGDIITTEPSVEDIENARFDTEFSLVLLSNTLGNDIENEISDIPEVRSCKVENLDIDKTIKKHNTEHKTDENKKKTVIESNKTDVSHSNKIRHAAKSIRVDIDRLDNLMNLVSELIIVKNAIEDTKDYEKNAGMADSIEYLQRVTSELHEAVMQVRMVPIGMAFNRFPRVVRDLSKQLEKDINLNIHGEDTEVDRTIIDEIGDPLLHLIRNSVDHGIELPKERIDAGKDSTGNIDLYAYHDGNNVVIEVKDDGQGIDIEGIKTKLISRDILSEEDISQLNDKEVVQYLFHPGFSTSESVSNISGRGVGLDVVKTTIESLGGIVEIETDKNVGTSFVIRLPLTLSIIKALLVRVGDEIYAIPLNSVREVVELPSNTIKTFGNRELISLRGELMPFIRLHNILDIENPVLQENMTVVIVKKGDKLSGLLVDSLIGQQDIVIKSLGRYLANIDILSGATILGDGSLAIILDINNIA